MRVPSGGYDFDASEHGAIAAGLLSFSTPALAVSRSLITGVVCGVRVEDVEDPLMREIRYTDKLIDELAKGKAMDKILRAVPGQPSR